jgi:proline iminopeptidase
MQSLFPEIEPYKHYFIESEQLPDGSHHQIYVEECGNPNGVPIVFLHGGPGSGCRPMHRQFFNPDYYRIILLDQRGCGRSLPNGELQHNTAQYLVNDLENIRQSLSIDKWILFGGSWGATLALIYAIQHPQHVAAMILRGTFLGREQDINWVYKEGGASKLFPEAWQQLISGVPNQYSQPLTNAYFDLLTSGSAEQQLDALTRLDYWESTIVTMRDHHFELPPEKTPGPYEHAIIQLHFALNYCFIQDNYILDNIHKIKQIPTQIIHGRYDMVCPVKQSWELSHAWPEAKLTILPLAGHAAGEESIIDALIEATNALIS